VLRIRHPHGALGCRSKSIHRVFVIVSLLLDFISRLLKRGTQRLQLSRPTVKDNSEERPQSIRVGCSIARRAPGMSKHHAPNFLIPVSADIVEDVLAFHF
jgi:hypothetical protein